MPREHSKGRKLRSRLRRPSTEGASSAARGVLSRALPRPATHGPESRRHRSYSRRLPERVGRYEVLSLLGRGGMASVYLAAEAPGAPLVAVKVPHSHIAEDAANAMLEDEAYLLAHVADPHVVGFVSFDRTADGPVLAMDFVPGVTAAVLGRASAAAGRALPVGVVVRIVCDALAGLSAAHLACRPDGTPLGIVHRDVSPQNVLVGADGTTHIVDFGIATSCGRLQPTTRDGVLKGKLGYMAPEQLYGTAADVTADLYACAVVAWELLAGESLFLGPSEADTFRRVLTAEVPPLTHRRADVPAALDEALRGALSPMRGELFPTALALRAALASSVPIASNDEVAAVVRELCVINPADREADKESIAEPPTLVDRPVNVATFVEPSDDKVPVVGLERYRIDPVAMFLAMVVVVLFGAFLVACTAHPLATPARIAR
ncbi:MAG: serine/threonine-protein kinase [Polyangiaceae bacterium]